MNGYSEVTGRPCPFWHVPSMSTVAVGVGVGIARIGIARIINPLLFTTATTFAFPPGLLGTAIVCMLIFCSVVLAPILEEDYFRSHLKDPSLMDVLKNSVSFGAIHFFNPGSHSLEQRIGHVVSSTIGGLFYCGAQVATDDTWAPLIAHSMYNASIFLI